MKNLMIGLFLLFVSMPATAQQGYPRDYTASWNWPTTYGDLSLIQPGDLRGGDLSCFRNQDTTPIIDAVPVVIVGLPGDFQETTWPGIIPQPGWYHCFLTAVTVDELSSDFSNEALKKFRGKPLPPVNFTAEDNE